MDFIPPAIEQYVEQHSDNEPQLLIELTKETYQKVLLPRMLSGHYQGRILSMFSKLVGPESILEIGTYTGYATLCLCEGLRSGGVVHTIDINEELVAFQRKYFDKSQWGSQIIQYLGDAIEIIPTLEIKFDLVFIDADKENYLRYFELIISKMNRGGVIISDNVLWSGKVTQPAQSKDESTKALQKYNAFIKNDTRVETLMLPIRDGLTISRVI